jgi:hypothetical protein
MVLYQSALTETDLYKNGLSLLDTALALWQLEVRCKPGQNSPKT